MGWTRGGERKLNKRKKGEQAVRNGKLGQFRIELEQKKGSRQNKGKGRKRAGKGCGRENEGKGKKENVRG